MSQVRFTSEHEWVSIDGDVARIGITDHAQQALGDIVFVELLAIGTRFAKGDAASVVGSVKAASDVYAPLSGEVVEVNPAIVDQPGLVNLSAEKDAWFFAVRLSNPAEVDGLMDRAAYDGLLAGQD